jgi:septal ring factor EnvC (AmiA/AmiB activator)
MPTMPPPVGPPPEEHAFSLRHQRLERVELLAAKTAREISLHAAQMAHIEDRVNGLAHAHDATRRSVDQSTKATTRLSNTLDRIDARIDTLVKEFSGHQLDNERDRRRWPAVAIWLWSSSLTAIGSVALLVWTNWPMISRWLNR